MPYTLNGVYHPGSAPTSNATSVNQYKKELLSQIAFLSPFCVFWVYFLQPVRQVVEPVAKVQSMVGKETKEGRYGRRPMSFPIVSPLYSLFRVFVSCRLARPAVATSSLRSLNFIRAP